MKNDCASQHLIIRDSAGYVSCKKLMKKYILNSTNKHRNLKKETSIKSIYIT